MPTSGHVFTAGDATADAIREVSDGHGAEVVLMYGSLTFGSTRISRGSMPHTILLCDDNATIRELVSALLVDEGYAVREASCLAEADALVGEGAISLVLADSGEGTREAAMLTYRRYCRVIGDRVPMIAFTAHRLSEEETREVGCAAVLAKPFDIEQLLGLIEEHLSGVDMPGGARAG